MREKTQIEHPKLSKPKEYKPRKLTQTQKFQAQTQKIKHKNTRKLNLEHTRAQTQKIKHNSHPNLNKIPTKPLTQHFWDSGIMIAVAHSGVTFKKEEGGEASNQREQNKRRGIE